MKNLLKVMLLIVMALLLVAPVATAAEEDLQDPPSVALIPRTPAISSEARGAASNRVEEPGAVAVDGRSSSMCKTHSRSLKAVWHDGRSTLLSLCLLRC